MWVWIKSIELLYLKNIIEWNNRMKYRACDIQRYPNQTFQNIYYIWLFHRLKPLIRFVSCLRLFFSLKLSIRNNDQDFFQPRRIKDNRAPCAAEESLSKGLAGSRSPPRRTVLGMRVGRICPPVLPAPGCGPRGAPAPARMLNARSDGYTEVWGQSSVSF